MRRLGRAIRRPVRGMVALDIRVRREGLRIVARREAQFVGAASLDLEAVRHSSRSIWRLARQECRIVGICLLACASPPFIRLCAAITISSLLFNEATAKICFSGAFCCPVFPFSLRQRAQVPTVGRTKRSAKPILLTLGF